MYANSTQEVTVILDESSVKIPSRTDFSTKVFFTHSIFLALCLNPPFKNNDCVILFTSFGVSMHRTLSLDAFRGLAIAGMILSGSLPFNGILPGWMYHAQVPPPNFVFMPMIPGITWVDLVFPFFLFVLGVAIPLAYQHKSLPTTAQEYGITIMQIFKRGCILMGFALALQHSKPLVQSAVPTVLHQLCAIVGFVLLFLLLTTIPKRITLSARHTLLIRALAFAGLFALLWLNTYRGQSFSFNRSDIIIVVLANVSVSGAILWLLTRNNHLLRLGILGFLLAFRLTQQDIGSWNHLVWYATPADWLYKLYFHQYLFIVLPGTMVGDFIVRWYADNSHKEMIPAHDKMAIHLAPYLLIGLSLLVICSNTILLYARWLVPNLLLSIAIIILIAFIMRNAAYPLLALHRRIVNFGAYWLLLGLTLEAFETGIKKDKSTLSYYAVTTGLACYGLVFFSLLIDHFRQEKWVALLTHSGQNPMIAYIAGSLLLSPLLALSGGDSVLALLNTHPVLGVIKGMIFTLGVLAIASLCTRYQFFWKT